jgi:hypothetical protein
VPLLDTSLLHLHWFAGAVGPSTSKYTTP